MADEKNRRDVLKLLGASGVGVVFSSALVGCAQGSANLSAKVGGADSPEAPKKMYKDFFFLQLTDTHWGFKGPPNPEADITLKNVVKLINTSPRQPDFIVFTGDLTHTTDDVAVRRNRLNEFKAIVSDLKCKNIKFMPGEHDASLDNGAVYKEIFGQTYYTFDHEGVHFVTLDNVSDLEGGLGDTQLAWLEADLAKQAPDQPIVIFSHRPLFDCISKWEWWTKDGEKALAILMKRKNIQVFYGHIHQDHFHMTGHIPHRSSKSLIFPLPAPGSTPKRAPLPWDAQAQDHGIGFRQMVVAAGDPNQPRNVELTDFTSLGKRGLPTQNQSPTAPAQPGTAVATAPAGAAAAPAAPAAPAPANNALK